MNKLRKKFFGSRIAKSRRQHLFSILYLRNWFFNVSKRYLGNGCLIQIQIRDFAKSKKKKKKKNDVHVPHSNTRFFYKQRFFSTQPQCCLTASWIELQMLLRCCWIHISIIIQGFVLCLVHLRPCLSLGLFMLYLCDLFFIVCLIFIAINHITSFKQTYLFFVHFLDIPFIFAW